MRCLDAEKPESVSSIPCELSEAMRQGNYIDKHWLLNLLNEEYEKLSSVEHGVYNASVSLAKGVLKSLKMKIVSR